MKHIKQFYIKESLSSSLKSDFLEKLAEVWSRVNEWEKVDVDFDRGCIVAQYGPFEIDWYNITIMSSGNFLRRIVRTPVYYNRITVYPEFKSNSKLEIEDHDFLAGLVEYGELVTGFRLEMETFVTTASGSKIVDVKLVKNNKFNQEDTDFLNQLGLLKLENNNWNKYDAYLLYSDSGDNYVKLNYDSDWYNVYVKYGYEPSPYSSGEEFWEEVYEEIANKYNEDPMDPTDVIDDYKEWRDNIDY